METSAFRKTVLFVVSFFLLWTLAWLLHNLLANTIWPSLTLSHNQALIYWAIMKILVWILFPAIYVRSVFRPESSKQFLRLGNAKRGVAVGLIAGLVWIGLSYLLQGRDSFHLAASATVLWTITGTPIAEEFTFRGVILSGLQKAGIRFWPANVITSVIFVLIHCLGWAFQGALTANLNPMLVGSILLLSLTAGWLRQRSNSLYSSVILHAMNNLYSATD
mgnify:CR=1 FL=1